MRLLLTTLVLAWAPSFLSWTAWLLCPRQARRAHAPAVASAVRLAAYAALLPAALWVLSLSGRPAPSLLGGLAQHQLGETLVLGLGLAAVLGCFSLAVRHAGATVLAWAYHASGRVPGAALPSTAVADAAWRFPAPAALLIAIGAAGYEELVWRGLLQAGLATSLDVPGAVAVTALGFAALHARQGPVAVAFSAVAATILGAVFAWRGDLAAVVLAHAAYNASAVIVDRWGPPAARRAAAGVADSRLSVSISG